MSAILERGKNVRGASAGLPSGAQRARRGSSASGIRRASAGLGTRPGSRMSLQYCYGSYPIHCGFEHEYIEKDIYHMQDHCPRCHTGFRCDLRIHRIFLFTKDRLLQSYACLVSFMKRLHGAILDVHGYWQASVAHCRKSYPLLHTLPDTKVLKLCIVNWIGVSASM